MDVAARTAELSRAVRLKVGAIIVKDDAIISLGFNGTPAGWDNECETKEWCTDGGEWLSLSEIKEQWPHVGQYNDISGHLFWGRYKLVTKPEVLHAESNCLSKVSKSTSSSKDAVIFVTHAPCMDCAKLIFQSGISSVYYRNSYRDTAGIDFLDKSHVIVQQT